MDNVYLINPVLTESHIKTLSEMAQNAECLIEAVEGAMYEVMEKRKSDTHDISEEDKDCAKKVIKSLESLPEITLGFSYHLASGHKTAERDIVKLKNTLLNCANEVININIPRIKPWKIILAHHVCDICEVHGLKFTSTENSDAHILINIICEALNIPIADSFAKDLITNFKKNKDSLYII